MLALNPGTDWDFNGFALRVRINAAESIPHLREIIEDFFLAPVAPSL